MAKKRAHLLISGFVQGVFFRTTAQSMAQTLGLTGWVKNRTDGKVEIVAEGEEYNLNSLIQWCHHGPQGAHVNNVQVNICEYKGEFDKFSVKYFY